MTLIDYIVPFIVVAIAVLLPIYLLFFDHWLAISKYNKTHEDQLAYTSLFTCGKRYRDWYLENFCNKKEKTR